VRKRSDVEETLRQRVLSARRFGTLPIDGRLPSARSVAVELEADPRVVVAAYRALERDGMVEQRPPSRAFFVVRDGASGREAGPAGAGAASGRADDWLVEILAQALERDVAVPDFPEHARRAVESARVRAACVECNRDELTWLCRELTEDYGIDATPVELDALPRVDGGTPAPALARAIPPELRRADLLVTTAAHADVVRALAERLGKTCVVVTQREDLARELDRLLAQGAVYFVATDPRFARKLAASEPARANPGRLRTTILGERDPATIPAGAPAYVMRTARDELGGVPEHVRALSTLHAFSAATREELLRYLVRANVQAARAR
jgi:hypothetical protein